MGKKKHKKQYKDDANDKYDYSDIIYDGDIRELMKNLADSIEGYIDYIETNAIFEGITEKEWDAQMEVAKKLVKKLRKGNPSVFDIETLNEVLASNHNLIVN